MGDPGSPGSYLIQQGDFLGAGLTGIVELLPDGYALKTPWPGERAQDSRDDMKLEALAYARINERLGHNTRFLETVCLDEERLTLKMEYMSNGTLHDYLRSHDALVTRHQRRLWAEAIAQGVALLHSVDIVHSDLTLRNVFLDGNLELKIGDFGCCSIDKSPNAVGTNVRLFPPRSSWQAAVRPRDDVFALGSCIFELMTGSAPYQETPSPLVCKLMELQQFPDLAGIEFGDIIRDCWLQNVSAGAVYTKFLEHRARKHGSQTQRPYYRTPELRSRVSFVSVQRALLSLSLGRLGHCDSFSGFTQLWWNLRRCSGAEHVGHLCPIE